MDGIPWNTWPTASFFTSRSMMTRPSGVICGVTARLSTAGLKFTVVPPFEAEVKYGISVPCSMVAFCLSAVIILGLETILPRRSASSACSSKPIKFPLPRFSNVNAREPVGDAPITGTLTFGRNRLAVSTVFVNCESPLAPRPINSADSIELPMPRLLLPRLYPARPPNRNPNCLLHLSSAMTILASIMTWRTGTSIFTINLRNSSKRLPVSCTKSVLVRPSNTALPRLDKMRCFSSESNFFKSSAF